ncbi:MAG: hypothetical protein ACLQIB_21395 [Isosphaeraceae bacterium]
MVKRLVTLAFSVCVVLLVATVRMDRLFAQGEAKKEAQASKTEPAKSDTSKAQPAKSADTTKAEPAKTAEPPLPPIPPEVQAKLDAARRAVAEAIVAAQDAGLVETSIDPPPILDILITGRATDARTLKNATAKKPYAVSPEVFAAWFTGYGKLEGINYVDDVRIVNPSAGLKQWYDQRARMLQQLIEEIRKAKGQTAAPKAETKAAEAPKAPAGAAAKTETPKKK